MASNKLLSGLVSLAVVGGGIGYLFYSSQGEAFEYYKHVDEVQRELPTLKGRRLQLHGYVQPGSIMRKLDRDHQQMEYKFTIINCDVTMQVRYAGLVPDTFKERAEVVLKGKLENDDLFVANEISAKGPSKYESKVDSAASTMCTKSDHAPKKVEASSGETKLAGATNGATN